MDFGKIILYALAAMLALGFAIETASAFACPEYFVFGHPGAETASPLALGARFAFTGWLWVGGALGASLAVAGRVGGEVQIKAGFFIRPLIALAVFIAVIALTGGAVGWYAQTSGRYPLSVDWAPLLPLEKHAPYVALQWGHLSAYSAAFIGSAALVAWVWKKRAQFTKMAKRK